MSHHQHRCSTQLVPLKVYETINRNGGFTFGTDQFIPRYLNDGENKKLSEALILLLRKTHLLRMLL